MLVYRIEDFVITSVDETCNFCEIRFSINLIVDTVRAFLGCLAWGSGLCPCMGFQNEGYEVQSMPSRRNSQIVINHLAGKNNVTCSYSLCISWWAISLLLVVDWDSLCKELSWLHWLMQDATNVASMARDKLMERGEKLQVPTSFNFFCL